MRKLIMLVLLITTASISTGHAQHYWERQRGGYHHHHHRNNGGWVAPLVGGMILGGAIYGLSQTPSYAAPMPAYRTECRLVPVFDRWDNYVGQRRECYQVPNY